MKDQVRGPTRSRRQHDRGFKDDLIAQSLAPGASVAAILLWRVKASPQYTFKVVGVVSIIGFSSLLLVAGYSKPTRANRRSRWSNCRVTVRE